MTILCLINKDIEKMPTFQLEFFIYNSKNKQFPIKKQRKP